MNRRALFRSAGAYAVAAKLPKAKAADDDICEAIAESVQRLNEMSGPPPDWMWIDADALDALIAADCARRMP